jgi:hypothetical protein
MVQEVAAFVLRHLAEICALSGVEGVVFSRLF